MGFQVSLISLKMLVELIRPLCLVIFSPGCSQLALDSISELAGRYLRHLGRTFRLLLDRNDPTIGPEVGP
jgi:hypothetical protein